MGEILFYISLLVLGLLCFFRGFLTSAAQKKYLIASYCVLVFLFLEAVLLFGFYLRDQRLLFRIPFNYNTQLFKPHPHMVVQGIPNAELTVDNITIAHNSLGFRGDEFSKKRNQRTRVIAVGGSTTYGVGVSNHDTWPALTEQKLGAAYEVLNFGLPATSTVEHIHLLATIVPEFKPDIVLLHIGLNDIRNMHAPNLKPDYSNFHAPSMVGNLGFCLQYSLPRVATLRASIIFLQKAGYYPDCSYNSLKIKPDTHTEMDDYAFELFKRNARTLVRLVHNLDAKAILVPQVLVEDNLIERGYSWWVPFLDERFLVDALKVYNNALAEIAGESAAVYLEAVDNVPWKSEHFVDASHLNTTGNYIFSRLLAQVVYEQKKEA